MSPLSSNFAVSIVERVGNWLVPVQKQQRSANWAPSTKSKHNMNFDIIYAISYNL